MMDFTKIKKLFIGGIELKQLFIAVLKNWARYSTESDGTTLYNGIGYKSGYRVRSGGAEGAYSASSCTGYIPVSPGDVIRVSGCQWGNTYGSAFNVYNSSLSLLGQACGDGSNNGQFGSIWIEYSGDSVVQKADYYEWVVPPTANITGYVSFIRVTGAVSDGSKLIVYVNDDKADTQIWKSGYKNWVKYAIDTDGSIYQSGKGYIDGYRLSSSGGLSSQANTVTTGFIEYQAGDLIRMSGVDWKPAITSETRYCYLAFYDSQFNVLGSINCFNTTAMSSGYNGLARGICAFKNGINIPSIANGVTTFDNINFSDTSQIAYFRVNGYGSGAEMIVTVNEEIE